MSNARPSIQHEGLVRVFRDRPALAVALVQAMSRPPAETPFPTDEARVTSSVPTAPGAPRFDMDLVVVLERNGSAQGGVLVEVQRSVEPAKRRKWPLAVASVRDELDCPASLLVVATTERVAQWARRPIDVGHPGYRLRPLVLGPGNLTGTDAEPRVEPGYEIELAALRGLVHARRSPEASWRVVVAALAALGGFDDPRAGSYITLVLEALPPARRTRVEEDMTEGRLPELSEVERRIGERAKLQGREEGQRELLLRLLRARFGDLQPAVAARIESASVSDIERWAERVVTREAETPEDVLA